MAALLSQANSIFDVAWYRIETYTLYSKMSSGLLINRKNVMLIRSSNVAVTYDWFNDA